MELSREVQRKFLTHTGVKYIAPFLSSSGVRTGEALQLSLSDVNQNADPAEVLVRDEYAKSRDKYANFLAVKLGRL